MCSAHQPGHAGTTHQNTSQHRTAHITTCSPVTRNAEHQSFSTGSQSTLTSQLLLLDTHVATIIPRGGHHQRAYSHLVTSQLPLLDTSSSAPGPSFLASPRGYHRH